VPAVAVIQRPRALSGFIGRKARLGGYVSQMSNPPTQSENCIWNGISWGSERPVELMV